MVPVLPSNPVYYLNLNNSRTQDYTDNNHKYGYAEGHHAPPFGEVNTIMFERIFTFWIILIVRHQRDSRAHEGQTHYSE